jgi:hypothetical protein
MKPCLTTILAAILAAFLLAVPAFAQDAAQNETTATAQEQETRTPEPDMEAMAIEDRPAGAVQEAATPVSVSHQGADGLGARLAYQLKETFNGSSLFTLTELDQRKIRLLLKTREEFPGRPLLGSIYSATWVFQASENMLGHFLMSEVGFLEEGEADKAAEQLTAVTQEVAERYAYLFEE